MNGTIIPILAFLSGSLAMAGLASLVFDLFFRDRSQINARLDEEFRGKSKEQARKSPLFKDLKLLAAETALSRPGYRKRFEGMIEQSGLSVTAERVLTIAAATGLVLGLLAAVFGGQWSFGVLGGLAGFALPIAYVNLQRTRRINKLRNQLPEAFELMSRAIRAGQTISGAFQVVAEDFEAPLAEEFAYCHEQQSLGLPQELALRDLAARTGVIEMQMFVVTLLVQRQSGGNPVEILNSLSTVIRKRIKLFDKVKALTGEGRMQALVLLVLPPVLFLALFILNRSYVEVLLERPEFLLGCFVSEALGALCIKKIISFEY